MIWQLFISGIACCGAGVYLFTRNVFEEDKKISTAILLMIAGICLITWATALYYRL